MPYIKLKYNIKNKAYHNLCIKATPPTGFGETVGLGLKFCIRTRRPDNKTNEGRERFTRDIRLKSVFGTDDNGFDEETKALYVKSQWQPPLADIDTEVRTDKFWNTLQDLHKIAQNKVGSNLSRFQYNVLKEIKANHLIVIRPADKNLGLCALDLDMYIERSLQDHLLTEGAYQRLTAEEARSKELASHDRFKDLIWEKHKEYFENNEMERAYFERSLEGSFRRPLFYINPKLHKTPWATRPVVSCVNSLPEIFSIWVDYWLKKLTSLAKSYLKDSTQAVEELRQMGPLPPGTRLFTADAKSMYTNIDTNHGIDIIKLFLNQNKERLPSDFPTELLVDALDELMHNNIFDFGDTHWLQLTGTAMGTSCACMYATLYYAYHENNKIIPTYSNRLKYYKRFIDDGLGIWVPLNDGHDNEAWDQFKEDLDDFGQLRWDVNPLSKSVDFLDLTISIVEGRIETKTYQKPLNLYQYIPPQSAHPPGMLRGLVLGNVGRYYIQNTHTKDYKNIVIEFYRRLRARGYNSEVLTPLFLEAHARAKTYQPTTKPKESWSPETIFVHLRYHPAGIPRHLVRMAYENACNKPNRYTQGFEHGVPCQGGTMRITKMTVALSRPKNISDTITSSKLKNVDGHKVSEIIDSIREH